MPTSGFILLGFFLAVYLYSSIPFGVLIGKWLKGVDIRKLGSGNIGTSNAFRALGPFGGLMVLLCDTSKGFLAVYFASKLPVDNLEVWQVIAGVIAILGHNFSLFLKFKGGKGIATSFGVILGLNYIIALSCFAFWGLIVATTKISSLASILAAMAFVIAFFATGQCTAYLAFATVAGSLAIWAHRANIKRLLNGTELKMSTKETKNVTKEDSKEQS